MLHISGVNLQGGKEQLEYDVAPDTCPICHTSVSPKIFGGLIFNQRLQIAFQCTKLKCGEMFIGTYTKRPGTNLCDFLKVAPISPQKADIPILVKELSPTFVEIYDQAMAAESMGLTQINGIGLRKALEFLAKDFSVRQSPKEAEKILKKPLGECIDEYLNDERLKATAKRAAWLGNDETHYTRKWEDKDIKDLKVLIRLTINWIENVLLTAQYIEEMPEKKEPK